MKRIFPSIRTPVWYFLAVLLLSVLLLMAWAFRGASDPGQREAATAPVQGGWTAWIDPVTGKLTKAPPPEAQVIPMDDQTMRQFSTYEVDLETKRMSDGTVVLDLGGRFRQGSAATVSDTGEVKIHRIGGEMFLSPDGREISQRLHDSDNGSGGDEQ